MSAIASITFPDHILRDDDGPCYLLDPCELSVGSESGKFRQTQDDYQSYSVPTLFPLKLYGMLEATSENDMDHIVSWVLDGRGFLVHNRTEFESVVLPKYFNGTDREGILLQHRIGQNHQGLHLGRPLP